MFQALALSYKPHPLVGGVIDPASGYLGAVAVALYPKDLTQQRLWLTQSCHQLKYDFDSATQLYAQMRELSQSQTHPQTIQDNLSAAVTYFQNHLHQMNYAVYCNQHYPIGSGAGQTHKN